jgi:hypothetical protein
MPPAFLRFYPFVPKERDTPEMREELAEFWEWVGDESQRRGAIGRNSIIFREISLRLYAIKVVNNCQDAISNHNF